MKNCWGRRNQKLLDKENSRAAWEGQQIAGGTTAVAARIALAAATS